MSPDYRIGPGDSLHVFVFENDQLSVTVPVRPDGKISTPLVEDMVAVGKTPSQLARDIEKSLSKYVKSPKVNVVVLVALSVYSQVKVIGQVKEPQALPYHEGMTVLDALAEREGLEPVRRRQSGAHRAHREWQTAGNQSETRVPGQQRRLDAKPAAPARRCVGRTGNPVLELAMTPELNHIFDEVRGAWRFR